MSYTETFSSHTGSRVSGIVETFAYNVWLSGVYEDEAIAHWVAIKRVEPREEIAKKYGIAGDNPLWVRTECISLKERCMCKNPENFLSLVRSKLMDAKFDLDRPYTCYIDARSGGRVYTQAVNPANDHLFSE